MCYLLLVLLVEARNNCVIRVIVENTQVRLRLQREGSKNLDCSRKHFCVRKRTRTYPRFILKGKRVNLRGKFHERQSESGLNKAARHARLKVENDEQETNSERRRKNEKISYSSREDYAASFIGGPRCTVGAPGTAFVWILGRLSCLIRYGLEIRPPRADSGERPLYKAG